MQLPLLAMNVTTKLKYDQTSLNYFVFGIIYQYMVQFYSHIQIQGMKTVCFYKYFFQGCKS